MVNINQKSLTFSVFGQFWHQFDVPAVKGSRGLHFPQAIALGHLKSIHEKTGYFI